MSEDLIRRSDAIKVAKEFWYKPDIAGALAELPAIEPKQGEWVNQHKWSNGFFERECSVCGAMKPLLRHTTKINFCPNCGASMRGKDDETPD